MERTPRIFISYAWKDGKQFADELVCRLTNAGVGGIWRDCLCLECGDAIWREIEEALNVVEILVLIATPAVRQSDAARHEWTLARRKGVRIFPVTNDETVDFNNTSRWLSKLQLQFIREESDWGNLFAGLRESRRPQPVSHRFELLDTKVVKREDELLQLKQQLLKDEVPLHGRIAILGGPGSGKTTLATILCNDDDIQYIYCDGVIPVTLGQNPNRHNVLSKLYKGFAETYETGFIDEEDAAQSLRDHLSRYTDLPFGDIKRKDYLFVIDDVWHPSDLELLQGAGVCNYSYVVTTRNPQVASLTDTEIHIGAMHPEESAKMLPVPCFDDTLKAVWQDITIKLYHWPLLLKLAVGQLKLELRGNDDTQTTVSANNGRLAIALQELIVKIEGRGITGFDMTNPVSRNDAFAESINLSLKYLDENEAYRYQSLAVFPEDTEVPIRLLCKYWNMDISDIRDIVFQLANIGLIEFNTGTNSFFLLDAIRDVIRQGVDLCVLNKVLTQHWEMNYIITEMYILQHVTEHLMQGEMWNELKNLLCDIRFIQARCSHNMIFETIGNYADVLKILPETRDEWREKEAWRKQVKAYVDWIVYDDHLNQQPLPTVPPSIFTMQLRKNCKRTRNTTHVITVIYTMLECLTAYIRWIIGERRSNRQFHSTISTSIGPTHPFNTGENNGGKTYDRRVAIIRAFWELLRRESHRLFKFGRESNFVLQQMLNYSYSSLVMECSSDYLMESSMLQPFILRQDIDSSIDNEKSPFLQTLIKHEDVIQAIGITADGFKAFSAGNDGLLLAWHLDTGAPDRNILYSNLNQVTRMCINPDGKIIACRTDNGQIIVFKMGREILKTDRTNKAIKCLDITPCGSTVIWSDSENAISLYNSLTSDITPIYGSPATTPIFRTISTQHDSQRQSSGCSTHYIGRPPNKKC